MDATGVSHIAICVADIDRSLGFYRDILGMTVGYDRIQDTTTGGLPHVYKPESTDGRPWGQPLKQPEGAPLNLG